MKKSELIATLGWIITCISPDNEKSDQIFDILKTKRDMQVLHKHYTDSFKETQLRDTFFPEEQ